MGSEIAIEMVVCWSAMVQDEGCHGLQSLTAPGSAALPMHSILVGLASHIAATHLLHRVLQRHLRGQLV